MRLPLLTPLLHVLAGAAVLATSVAAAQTPPPTANQAGSAWPTSPDPSAVSPEQGPARPMTVEARCPKPDVPRPPEWATREGKLWYKQQVRAAKLRRVECIRELREELDAPRNRARQRARFGLALGYDGALLSKSDVNGTFRAPSVVVGGVYRQHFARSVGMYAGLLLTLGPGYIGDEFPIYFILAGDRQLVGPSLTGLGEAGLVVGPWPGASFYIHVGGQLRMVVPGASSATVEVEDPAAEESVEERIRWKRPTWAAGFRAGPGITLGDVHQYFVELGIGGGWLLSHDGDFFSAGLRAGMLFGS